MGQVKLPSDFKEFLKSLNQAPIECLVIGNHAVSYLRPSTRKTRLTWSTCHSTNSFRKMPVP